MFSMQVDWHCLCGDPLGSHRTTAEGEECWGHCQKTPRDCRGLGYRPIDHSGRTPAITAIFAKAIELGLPHAYSVDLSSDYRMLIGQAFSFLWIIRENGSDIISLEPRYTMQDRALQREGANGLLRYRQHNN